MILKVPVYFQLELDDEAKIQNVELLKNSLANELEEYLSDSSFKLAGSFWSDDRIKARFVSSEEALEALRTNKKS